MTPDITRTREALQAGTTDSLAQMRLALDAAQSRACAGTFLRLWPEEAFHAAAAPQLKALPLAGLAVSVKDLYDIAGQPTPAGSRVLQDAPPALADAAAVARLKAAGGVVIGRTHMTEFAFSGVGTNPHFPVPHNPADPAVARIPGGSSSGAAVSVATGAAFVGLGSDTGGSIRIPAALCGVVGFKSTARLVPTAGALPLSTTLDTACAITRSVEDAIVVHEILAGCRVERAPAPLSAYRLAVPATQMLDGMDATVARTFDRALLALRAAGAHVETIPLPEIADLGSIQATGGYAAAESYAWHRQLLQQRGAGYDPRVRTRIERGARMAAWEYIELMQARQAWVARLHQATRGYDALLSPTVPIVAPPLAPLAPADGVHPAIDGARDDTFFRINALLLRNPSTVNMLDGCAISIPCHAPGDLPVGLMVWHGALQDDRVLNIALQAQRAFAALDVD